MRLIRTPRRLISETGLENKRSRRFIRRPNPLERCLGLLTSPPAPPIRMLSACSMAASARPPAPSGSEFSLKSPTCSCVSAEARTVNPPRCSTTCSSGCASGLDPTALTTLSEALADNPNRAAGDAAHARLARERRRRDPDPGALRSAHRRRPRRARRDSRNRAPARDLHPAAHRQATVGHHRRARQRRRDPAIAGQSGRRLHDSGLPHCAGRKP